MPCDYSKYPDNWKTEIRPSILERASHRCEWCNVNNYDIGYRNKEGIFIPVPEQRREEFSERFKLIKIVLTIAHINDPDPMNCDPANLAALCQKCHNKHDAPMRAKNRKKAKVR